MDYPQIEADAIHLAGVTNHEGIIVAMAELHRIQHARGLTDKQAQALATKAGSHVAKWTQILKT